MQTLAKHTMKGVDRDRESLMEKERKKRSFPGKGETR
jgi:hypothetical protein